MFRDDPGDVTTVKHLLQEPADPNCRDPQTHKSPIVKAILTHGFSLFLVGGCFSQVVSFWRVGSGSGRVVQIEFVFSRLACLFVCCIEKTCSWLNLFPNQGLTTRHGTE